MSRPRYVRHRKFPRLRHSSNFIRWLREQGARLGVEPDYIFDELLVKQKLTYAQVEALSVDPSGAQLRSGTEVQKPSGVGDISELG